jgi:ABC-type antimicrobial peptide transport system ATPase subunit
VGLRQRDSTHQLYSLPRSLPLPATLPGGMRRAPRRPHSPTAPRTCILTDTGTRVSAPHSTLLRF